MHIFNISQSHTTQLQNKPAHLPCPYRLPPDSRTGSMTGVMSPAQCMPGHHKRAEAYTPKRVQVSGPDEEKKCLGNKGYSHLSSWDSQFLKILPTLPPLGSPLQTYHPWFTNPSKPQLKIRVTNYFFSCVLNLAQIKPLTLLRLKYQQNMEFPYDKVSSSSP